ncbi:tRNA pseudouridine(13) synthase TruD [Geotalea sp. SG265]|uniref:tRNA pseudouridine(13) synthase TruD n=1 Tax=Geotalea sp. SG265 TaxID=2922867 RepID=UPI001FB03971|nr:tRNA pseudouridine(13) synthase TruD [Geotalea sp. SG265]
MHTFLTRDIPGIGGIFKETAEDFRVTEIPLYEPCGDGEHTYAVIEKSGITTLEAVRRIARTVGVGERDVGYAGMKDARGITRQTISLPRVAPEQLLRSELPGIKIVSAVRHKNKLKLGHLRGNRFRIRIGGVDGDAGTRAAAVLAVLEKRGVPNFFGEQRYGAQGNSHLIGGAMLRGDYGGAINALIGEPDRVTDERWRLAIEAFKAGDLEKSLGVFPPHCRTARELLQKLVRLPDAPEKAFRAVHPRLRKLYLSAFQSELFDRVLAERLDSLDRVFDGDVAYKHDNGACFLVTDAAAEAPRASLFEISATGPMFGCRMKEPEGEPLVRERRLLEAEGLTLQSFALDGGLRMEGERRPLRVPVKEIGIETDGSGLVLEFSLPKGSYATTVLREVMKPS